MSDEKTNAHNYEKFKITLIVLVAINLLALIAAGLIITTFWGNGNGNNPPENPDNLRVYSKRIIHYSETTGDIYPNTFNDLVELPESIDNYYQSYIHDLGVGDLCNCQYSMCPWETDNIFIHGNDEAPVLDDQNPPIIEMRNIGNGIFRFSPIPKNIPKGQKIKVEMLKMNNENLQNVFFFVEKNEIQLKLSNKDLTIEPAQ